MSLRRWLTSRYDLTGISRLFYRRGAGELGAILLVAILTGHRLHARSACRRAASSVYDGPNAFLPSSSIHIFDWILAGVLLAFLLEQRRAHVVVHHGPRQGLAEPRWAATSASVWLLPAALPHAEALQRVRAASGPGSIHLALDAELRAPCWCSSCSSSRDMAGGPGDRLAGPRLRLPRHASGLVGATILVPAQPARRSRRRSTGTRTSPTGSSSSCSSSVALTGILQHILHRSGLDAAANVTYIVHLMRWSSRCWRSRCRSASGRTWPTGRWPCTSPQVRRDALARARRGDGRGAAEAPSSRAASGRPEEVSDGRAHGSASTSATAAPTSPRWSTATRSRRPRRTCPASSSPAPTSTCAPTPGQEMIAQDIEEQRPRPRRGRRLQPADARADVPRAPLQTAGLNPYLVRDGQHPRAVQLGPRRPARRPPRRPRTWCARPCPRVAQHEPLERLSVDMCPNTLVLGGGIAGLTAALELADAGKPVFLVERSRAPRRQRRPRRPHGAVPRLGARPAHRPDHARHRAPGHRA